jgi:hypothetical protein
VLEDLFLFPAESIEARCEQGVDRRGDRDVAEVPDRTPGAVVFHEPSVVDEHADDLLDVQRVPLGCFDDAPLRELG